MNDTLSKLFLAIVGGTAMTYENGQKLIEEMIAKGKVSVDEGKSLADELKKTVKRKDKSENDTVVEDEQKAQLAEELLAMRQEINELKHQLAELEDKDSQAD